MATVTGNTKATTVSLPEKPSNFEIAIDYTTPGHEGEAVIVGNNNPSRNPQAIALAAKPIPFNDQFVKAAQQSSTLSSMFDLVPELESKVRIAINDANPEYNFNRDHFIKCATRFDQGSIANLPALISSARDLARGSQETDLIKYIKKHDLSFTLRIIDKVRQGIKDAEGNQEKINKALLYMDTLLKRIAAITTTAK